MPNFQGVAQPKGFDAVDGLLMMTRLLWKTQHDRHGSDDEETPLHVAQGKAEAAVHLAITLVQWFRSGAVARK